MVMSDTGKAYYGNNNSKIGVFVQVPDVKLTAAMRES
jgi:hypothetical protein